MSQPPRLGRHARRLHNARALRRQQHCFCCCVTSVPASTCCYSVRKSGIWQSRCLEHQRVSLARPSAQQLEQPTAPMRAEVCWRSSARVTTSFPCLTALPVHGGRCAPRSGACGAAARQRAWGSRTSPPQPPRPAQARPERAAMVADAVSACFNGCAQGAGCMHALQCWSTLLTSCSITELAVGVAIVLSSDGTRWSENQAHWQRQACYSAPLLHT